MNTHKIHGSRTEAAGYALLRVGYGLVVLTHGLPKALRIPHGSVADPFASTTRLIQNGLGVPFATETAILVTLLETAGALMLAAGLYTRQLALLFVAEMTGIALATGPKWPWLDHGIEYPVVLGALAAYIALCGENRYSLDALRRRSANLQG